MITPGEAHKNPELMIKYKDDLKDIRIFDHPWYSIFWRHPYLFREFPDRFDELGGWTISYVLEHDPALVLGLKEYLHRMSEWDIAYTLRKGPALILGLKDHLHILEEVHSNWVLQHRPEVSLCLKHRNNPDKIEAAYYVAYPHELDNLNKEEKREMSERIIELLKEEKI
jgi:hypothetical protein